MSAALMERQVCTDSSPYLSEKIIKRLLAAIPEPSREDLLSTSRRVQIAYRSTLPTDQEIDILQVVQSQEAHSLFAIPQPTRRQNRTKRTKRVLPPPTEAPTSNISAVLGTYQQLYDAGQEGNAYAALTRTLIQRFHVSF